MPKFPGRKVVLVAAALTIALTIPMLSIYAANAATDSLLSLDRSASASSVAGPTSGPDLAFDAASTTSWTSATSSNAQWIKVDLGVARQISQIRLDWAEAYASGYLIEISTNGWSWRTIYRTTDGNGGHDQLNNISGRGRYVRLTTNLEQSAEIIKGQAAQRDFSLRDMSIYGLSNAYPEVTE